MEPGEIPWFERFKICKGKECNRPKKKEKKGLGAVA